MPSTHSYQRHSKGIYTPILYIFQGRPRCWNGGMLLCFFFFAGSGLLTSVIPFYGELFQSVLSLYIAHRSFSQDRFRMILPLLKNLLSTSSGVAYPHICKVLTYQHFSSCESLSTTIIIDPLHPLHPWLANAVSTSSTRTSFKLLRCRASLYRNTRIPSLARHLVNLKQERDLLSSNLALGALPLSLSFCVVV